MWLWLLFAIVLGLVFMICRDAECWSETGPVSPRPERSLILTSVLLGALCICFVGAMVTVGRSH
jgi:hypothetical protein